MSKKVSGIVMAVALVIILLQACVKDVGKAPLSSIPLPPPPPGACDTITYVKHIKPIIDLNCTGCHAIGGSKQDVPLETYAQCNNLSDRIKVRAVDPNASPMPQGGSLTSTEKSRIQCWIDNGKKEN